MRFTPRNVLLALVVLFVVIQIVPFGRAHANPPVLKDAPWPDAQSRALAVRACYDCHSNETVWPWYSQVAPVSWYLQHHVDEGRGKLNFSEWGRGRQSDEAAASVQSGKMPPWNYLPLHPSARLTDAERATLVAALEKMTGEGGSGRGGENEGGEGGEGH